MHNQTIKADGGKSNPLLLEADMPDALEIINRVLDYGERKYVRLSWREVLPERWDAAARRHRRDRDKGQLFDAESGLLHMAHEAAGLIIQIQKFAMAHPELDLLSFRQPPQAHKQPPLQAPPVPEVPATKQENFEAPQPHTPPQPWYPPLEPGMLKDVDA